jgi:hemoglobin-like flavoprotein
MTPTQVLAVQRSFSLVVPIKEQAAAMFYARLFEIDPSLKPLFRGNIKDQERKLISALAVAITGLARPDSIISTVEGMGAKHLDYGVTDHDYETVANALLWTLEKGLGPEFTPDVKEAWVAAYTFLADIMKRGAKSVSGRARAV